MKELVKAFAFLTFLVLLGSVMANSAHAQSFSSTKISVQPISSPTIVDSSSLKAPLSIAPIFSASPGSFQAATNPELDYRQLNPFSPGRRILESHGQSPSAVFGLNSNPSNRVYGDKFGSYPGQGAYRGTTATIRPISNSKTVESQGTSGQVIENWSESSYQPTQFRSRFRGRIQLRPFGGLFRR